MVIGVSYAQVNLASDILAGGAFLVAVVTLYLTNLKMAKIDVLPMTGRHWVRPSGTLISGTNMMLAEHADLRLSLSAYNGGARAGVLTSVRLEELREVPEEPPLFEQVPVPLELLHPPQGLEAGDVDLLDLIRIELRPVMQATDDRSVQALAAVWEQLTQLADRKTRLDVRVSWRYATGRRRLRNRHELRERGGELAFSVPMEPFRRNLRNEP